MTYGELKCAVMDLILPYSDEYTTAEKEDLERGVLYYTNLAIDNIQREVWPLEKTAVLTGTDPALPADLIDLLGVEEEEPFRLSFGTDGAPKIHFETDGEHIVRYVYNSGPVTGNTYVFAFPNEVMGAITYFVAYHLLAGENDTRQYAAYFNLYNQACANIISSRRKRCRFTGGMKGV